MIWLTREEAVFVLRLDAGENRFSSDAVAEANARLDEVEKADGPKALVTTGTGKFYSNGLDLDYMRASGDPAAYLASVLDLIARVLVFPAWTVAAINGHAFGAGALLAVAHDDRVMRADRGYFCMPEVDMKLPLHPGMTAILQARLPHPPEVHWAGPAGRLRVDAGEDVLSGPIVKREDHRAGQREGMRQYTVSRYR